MRSRSRGRTVLHTSGTRPGLSGTRSLPHLKIKFRLRRGITGEKELEDGSDSIDAIRAKYGNGESKCLEDKKADRPKDREGELLELIGMSLLVKK